MTHPLRRLLDGLVDRLQNSDIRLAINHVRLSLT